MFGLKRKRKFECKAKYYQKRFFDDMNVEDFADELLDAIEQAPALKTGPKLKYGKKGYEFSIDVVDGYRGEGFNIPTRIKLNLRLKGGKEKKSNLHLKVSANFPVKSIDEIKGYLDDYFNYSEVHEIAKQPHGPCNGDD